MIASLPSGRRRLLVAGRLVLPLLDGGADIGRDMTPDELTGVTPSRINRHHPRSGHAYTKFDSIMAAPAAKSP